MQLLTLKLWRAVVLAAAVAGCGSWGWAEAPATGKPAVAGDKISDRYMFEDRIKPGMKGYGLTVIRGGKIEKFDIEVIDVMKNFMPGENAILVRCSGLGLETSGIIAGMSGLPVFSPEDGKDKMIGAVAFGWGTLKEPIGGVQPIRQMLNIPIPGEKGVKGQEASAGGGGRWAAGSSSFLKAAAMECVGWGRIVGTLGGEFQAGGLRGNHIQESGLRTSSTGLQKDADPWHPPTAMGLRPLASPLMVSGASREGLAYLASALEGTGLVPMSSAAGGLGGQGKMMGGVGELKPGEVKLERGSAIAIPILTGDMDLSAIGTVTEVQDGRVWAFGHAMFAQGPTELPIATGYIYSIMPSLVQSFKLGASYEEAGALVTDEQTGIVGQLGKKTRYVPIEMRVRTKDGVLDQTYHYALAPHPNLTPEILGMALTETLTARRQLPKEYTLRLSGELVFEGATLKVDSLGAAEAPNIMSVLLPVAVLSDNPYEALKLKGVKLDMEIEGKNRAAEIKSVVLKRDVVAPGEELVATVELVPFQAKSRFVEVRLKVPEDATEGNYELAVGSSMMALSEEERRFPQRYEPEDAKTLVAAVQRVLGYEADKLYASLAMDVGGVSEGGKELKDLPATRVAMYASEKRSNAVPLYEVVRAKVNADDLVVMRGGETFRVTVDKDAGKRFHATKETPERRLREGGTGREKGLMPGAEQTRPAPGVGPGD